MDVGHRHLIKRLGGLATVSVMRQRPHLRVKVSASLEDVNSRYLWLKEILETAPDGFTWVCLKGGFETYVLELWNDIEFE